MEKVKVKGYNSGILVIFEEGLTFDEAIEAVKEKFAQSRKFFGKSIMSVRFQGIDLSIDEEMEMCDAITENCDLTIACVIDEDEDKNGLRRRNLLIHA